MQTFELKIILPYEIMMNLRKSAAEVADDIKLQAAIRYYKKRLLSMGKAAELAGMTRLEFIDCLRFNKEVIFDYTDQELEEIQADAMKLESILK